MPGTSQAWAALYDALSLAFAYPDDEFFRSLQDGGFTKIILENLPSLPAGPALSSAGERLCAASEDIVKDRDRQALETEYVSLFEMSRDKSVLHPCAHLYDRQRREQQVLINRLSDLYQEFGVSLAPNPGREAPDHITVQLEFMSYLWKLWEHVAIDDSAYSITKVRDGIRLFHQELGWIADFAARLVDSSKHSFYVPLSSFAAALVAAPPLVLEK